MDNIDATATAEESSAEITEETTATEEIPAGDGAGEGAASEEAPEGEKPKPAEPKYSDRVQRRISDLTAKRKEAEEKAAKLEAENAALKRKTEAGARPQPPDPNAFMEDGEINSPKYLEAQRKYEDTLHNWRQAQEPPASAPAASVAAGTDDTIDLNPVFETFNERANAMRGQHPDFDEVINREVFPQDKPEMYLAIFESEVGPEIAYYLGSNEAEAKRIGALSPEGINREIGKLEGRFSVAPERRAVSNAPGPLSPVQGNASVEKDPEDMTDEEWSAWHDAEQAKKLNSS